MLSYSESLVGIPYRWWNPNVSCCENTGPFWASEGGEIPIQQIQKGQLNCAGFLNVICRKFGLEIPGAKEQHIYAGGTKLWWDYFKEKGLLKPYDSNQEYPIGTILLREYFSEEDQGHIAIVYDKTQIIHSWPEKGVVIEEPMKDYYKGVVVGFLKN